MSKIKETNKYDMFVVPEYNRPVYQPFVNRLKKSMKENGFLASFPVSVVEREDGLFDVTDGQHRFRAARELGIPVKYVVSDSIIDPASVPASRRWSAADFVNRFAQQGIEEYQAVLEFAKQYGITVASSLKILTNDISNNKRNKVETGRIVITELGNAQMAASAAREAQRANKNLLINPLVMAIYTMSRINDLVPFGDLTRRVETNADQMMRFGSVDRGYGEIEKAYNFKLPHDRRKPLEMLIKQRLLQLKKNFGKASK